MEFCGEQDKNKNKNSFKRRNVTQNPSSSDVKECLTEYSLQDKYETLKNMLDYNEKHVIKSQAPKRSVHDANEQIGVKECLQPQKLTPFQTLVLELRYTIMNSYWDKEVGKTRYQVVHLPVGMDPLKTTFGIKNKYQDTMSDVLHPKEIGPMQEHIFHRLYRKTHNNYYPSEQIDRNYNQPFHKETCFGRPYKVDVKDTPARRLFTWINNESVTVTSGIQANFMNRAQSRVGQVKNIQATDAHHNMVHGKSTKVEEYGALQVMRDCPVNTRAISQLKYLEHINNLRYSLKKRVPEVPFSDIYQDLFCLDENYTNVLPTEDVLKILATYHIYPDKALFGTLLNILQLCTDEKVHYKDLVDLLNWRCDFPTLPKTNDMPPDCIHYSTTYNETIGDGSCRNSSNTRTYGIPSERTDLPYPVIPKTGIRADKEHLGDQTSVHALISPSIFTKHNLSHIDFLKVRGKEEIKSIFENIGTEFPGDSFDIIWHEGLKRDCTGGVCVDTFRNLLNLLAAASYNNVSDV